MTYNQKYIYQQLLKGAFIVITPTGGRPYTLYDAKMRPLKRMSYNDFIAAEHVYGHHTVLKKVKNRYYISRKGVRSLRKNSWLKKQLETV